MDPRENERRLSERDVQRDKLSYTVRPVAYTLYTRHFGVARNPQRFMGWREGEVVASKSQMSDCKFMRQWS